MKTENQRLRFKRWHSLAGVFPLGAFLLIHVATNAVAVFGREPGDAWPGWASPWVLLPEVVLIYLPLLFHGGYGLFLSFTPDQSSDESWYERSAPERKQELWLLRGSGLVVLVFVVYHLYHLRLPLLVGRLSYADMHSELAATLSSTTGLGIPAVAMAYLLGLAATALHLCYGLRAYLRRHPALNARHLVWTDRGTAWLGVGLFVAGTITVLQLATGAWFPEF